MKKLLVLILLIFTFYTLVKPNDDEIVVSAYVNHCWRCGSTINSSYCSRCSDCGWYICIDCGACNSSCERMESYRGNSSSTSSKDDNDSDWIVWVLLLGVGIPALVYYLDKR